jgi:hypothetical protein
LRRIETENFELKADLGLFQRLLPAKVGPGLTVRAMQASLESAGQLHCQVPLMQNGKVSAEFSGGCDIQLVGTLDGLAWSFSPVGGTRVLQPRPYARAGRADRASGASRARSRPGSRDRWPR